MSIKLFNEFQPATVKQWQQKVLKELNGQSIEILTKKERVSRTLSSGGF